MQGSRAGGGHQHHLARCQEKLEAGDAGEKEDVGIGLAAVLLEGQGARIGWSRCRGHREREQSQAGEPSNRPAQDELHHLTLILTTKASPKPPPKEGWTAFTVGKSVE